MQNRCNLMNSADLFRNLSLFFRYIAKIYAWRMNDLLHLYASRNKNCARSNLQVQKFNPFYAGQPTHRYYRNRLSFYVPLPPLFFCLISYISFSVLSFQQNHLQKTTDEHGFSTSSNLHSLHELYPQEGIAQIDALVNRRVNFYPHFLLQHSELMQGYITFCLHPTLFLYA